MPFAAGLIFAADTRGEFFFILKTILHEGHTPAAEAASAEGQQQDTAVCDSHSKPPSQKIAQLQYSKAEVKVIKRAKQQRHSRHCPNPAHLSLCPRGMGGHRLSNNIWQCHIVPP